MSDPGGLREYYDPDAPDWAAIEAMAERTVAEAEAEAAGDPHTAPAAAPPEGHDQPWHTYSAASILGGTWAPVAWVCEGLDLGPGRPCGLVGSPGAGKNEAAQALGLAVASGRPAFGRLPVRRGRVLHLTWDMGARGTSLRYRRLAVGMGLRRADLEGHLVLCAHPAISLVGNPQAIVAAFAERMAGFDLVIVDNARAATPGVSENDSEFGEYVARLGMASERVGATVLYLHHTRKGGQGGIEDARGSSAIVGASGSVWMLSGRGDEPRELTHERGHECTDTLKAPLWLVREPAAQGVSDIHLGGHQAWRLVAQDDAPHDDETEGAILAALEGGGMLGSNELARAVKGRKSAVHAALRSLVQMGRVHRVIDGQRHYFRSGGQNS